MTDHPIAVTLTLEEIAALDLTFVWLDGLASRPEWATPTYDLLVSARAKWRKARGEE